MKRFVHTVLSQRVVFGAGTFAELGDELTRFDGQRALVLSTPDQRLLAQATAAKLGAKAVGVFDRAAMHVPIETVDAARSFARSLGADCVVAVGGGSTIGLAKALALEPGLRVVAVPTTYAGSEMTPIYGITESGAKRTGRDPRVLPSTVIYDPDLTRSLPAATSVMSGINAVAHAAEALYAVDRSPITDLLAQEGIAALARAVPVLARSMADVSAVQEQARVDALYGAWLCGSVLGSVSLALHHKLCHILGGSFDLPHAHTHAIVLPHALAYNAAAAPDAMRKIRRALGGESAAQGAYDLAAGAGLSMAMRDIGFKAEDLDSACRLALEHPYPNPRALEPRAIRQLLQDAFDGVRPVR
ncbi:maleylacetate reductase [Variovorax sp. RA8]|uniref:maleylacetate reductase n=1 Tax=Variovorax sp. (strain JCM 16519 / RA8) TaxID=662548 RepID=UPI000A69C5BE|nr:maleylacetate reductase [Variovorax sp. RA8]VTU41518.1 Maleylacetate reductase [Variovorax sp. RA8]